MERATIIRSRKLSHILQEGKTLWIRKKLNSQPPPQESQIIGWLLIRERTFTMQPWTSEAESDLRQPQSVCYWIKHKDQLFPVSVGCTRAPVGAPRWCLRPWPQLRSLLTLACDSEAQPSAEVARSENVQRKKEKSGYNAWDLKKHRANQ